VPEVQWESGPEAKGIAVLALVLQELTQLHPVRLQMFNQKHRQSELRV
jgi:hypothetical protein